MPAFTASAGLLIFTSLPLRKTFPEVFGSAPISARASSVRPAPIRPAKPKISPLRSSNETSRRSFISEIPSTFRTTSLLSGRTSGR